MPQYVVNFADTQSADQEGRLDAPSFHRNHEPIWSVLGPFLADQSGDVLEMEAAFSFSVAKPGKAKKRHEEATLCIHLKAFTQTAR